MQINSIASSEGFKQPLTRDNTMVKKTVETADSVVSTNDARLQEACRSFEVFMVAQMLKTISEGRVKGEGVIPESRAEKIFEAQRMEIVAEQVVDAFPILPRGGAIGNDGGGPTRTPLPPEYILPMPPDYVARGGFYDQLIF